MTDADDILDLIASRGIHGVQPVVDSLNRGYMPAALTRYNSEFGLRYFGRPWNELIPTAPRLLTAFRSRLGPLLEYGIATTLDSMFLNDYGHRLRLSFAVASEYPDYYLRDEHSHTLLRIDAKALHDESVEFSARFDLPTGEISPLDDLLLYLAWKWSPAIISGEPCVFPQITEALFVPAVDIARERDARVHLTGGSFDAAGRALTPTGLSDTNFGKINRIVHESRREAADQSPNIRAFLEFTARHADAVQRAARTQADPEPTPDELGAG